MVGCRETVESEMDGNNSISSGSIHGIGSQEETDEDEPYAYAEPSVMSKNKRVNEPFNPCTTGKDIKWKWGLIFGSKQQFKNAVGSFLLLQGDHLNTVWMMHRGYMWCVQMDVLLGCGCHLLKSLMDGK